MNRYLVRFDYGKEGWHDTSLSAAKGIYAETPGDAIRAIKLEADQYYANCRNFRAITLPHEVRTTNPV